MNLPFQYKDLLWLLLLIPVMTGIYFYAYRKKKKVFKQLGDEALVNELTAGYDRSSFFTKFLLAVSALLLILLAIANLRSKTGEEKVNRNGIDVMIALDVSKSMLAQDIQPNRLERAKQLLGKLMDKLDNDRIGLVVFAGRAYLQMPLTADHSAAKMYLSAATPETVPAQGTVIGDALKACFASFNPKEKKYKAVVLISDGEDHDEKAIEIAQKMAEEGVVINTVGIGSPEGANILDENTGELKKDQQGNVVVTKLNEEELANIAAKGNGEYALYTNTDAVVSKIYNSLSTMDQKAVEDNSLNNYQSWFQYLLGAALLFLVIELLISEMKRKNNAKMKAAAMLFFISLGFSASAQQNKELLKKGNDAYKQKDYATAIAKYNEAAKTNGADPLTQYNLGNALYKSDKKEDAVNAYDKASEGMKVPVEKSDALYNKGVVQQNDKKLEECIAAYKKALIINPNNVDARHNLEIALREQKKQQEKKNQDDQKDKKDQDKKKNNDKKDGQNKKNNMSPDQADQKLKALQQQEKALQDKLHKVNAAAPQTPEKDW